MAHGYAPAGAAKRATNRRLTMTDVPHSVEDFEHYYDSMDFHLDELEVEEI